MTESSFYSAALCRLRGVVQADTGVDNFTASETLRLEQLAHLAGRLEQLRAELDGQPLVVTGSRKQPVVDGRVTAEAKLVEQLDRQLVKLVRDVENRRLLDEVRQLTTSAG